MEKKNINLESKIEENYNKIHDLESANEEYRVTYNKMDGHMRSMNKKFQELQKKYTAKDQRIKGLLETNKKLENEKL